MRKNPPKNLAASKSIKEKNMIINTQNVVMTTYRSDQFEKFKSKYGLCDLVFNVIEEVANDIEGDIDPSEFIIQTHVNCDFDIIAVGSLPLEKAIEEIERIIGVIIEGY